MVTMPRVCRVERVSRRNQRSAFLIGFDNDDRQRDPADDPIAKRKVLRKRRCAGSQLADQRPIPAQACRQLAMLGGIDDVGPAAKHADRRSTGGEAPAVRGTIGAAC